MAQKGTILIVDDVEINRSILKETYKDDYFILEATNGNDCLHKINEYHTQLKAIFLDIIMPEMDGFAVLHIMEEKGFLGYFPVFLITTEVSDYVVNRAYKYGVVDVIPKPFDMLIIKQRISNIIHLYEVKAQTQSRLKSASNIMKKQRQLYNVLLENLTGLLSQRALSYTATSEVVYLTEKMLRKLVKYGKAGNIAEKNVSQIAQAAAFFDIGKSLINDSILQKPAVLSLEEKHIMQSHCRKGAMLLEKIPQIKNTSLLFFAKRIALYHHERIDGTGYPKGISGEQIPLEAQIVGILNVYTALKSSRPYRKEFTQEEAQKMIASGECGAFSKDILDAFDFAIKNS